MSWGLSSFPSLPLTAFAMFILFCSSVVACFVFVLQASFGGVRDETETGAASTTL